MKTKHIIYCIFGVLMFAACSGIDYEQQLERFEEMNRTDVPMTPDSVQPLVRHYDHWWHSRNHRMRAYYMLGCAYRDQGSAPRALENYQHAVNVADTTDADCDLNVLMRVHSQMAQVFLLQRLPEQNEQELKTAERLALMIGDTLSALIFEEGLCNIYFNKEDYNKCIKLSILLQEKYKSSGYYNDSFIPLIYCVKSYMMMKEYTKVKHFLDIYEKCPYLYSDPEKINGGIGALYIQKGQYFVAVQEADSAEYYFRKALPFQEIWENRLLITEGLYQVYELKHNADSALKYTNLYSEAKERSFNEAQTTATIQTKAMYDYGVEQQKAQEKTKESARRRNWLYALTALCGGGVLFYLYQHEKKKRKISELRQLHQKAVQELRETELSLFALQKEKSQDENRIAEFLQEKDNLERLIKRYEGELITKASWEKKTNLESSEIVGRFKRYRDAYRTDGPIEEKHWLQLQHTIEQICPNFHAAVNMHQQLSETEYRICMLIKLGLAPSDIDIILNKEYTFASTMRKRLCKKILQTDGNAAELDKFIASLW